MPWVMRPRAIKAKVLGCPAGVSDKEGHALGLVVGEDVARLGPQGTDESEGSVN